MPSAIFVWTITPHLTKLCDILRYDAFEETSLVTKIIDNQNWSTHKIHINRNIPTIHSYYIQGIADVTASTNKPKLIVYVCGKETISATS
jgi:hypothetical protein